MKEKQVLPSARIRFDWREDLAASRDLRKGEIEAYGYVLGWIEKWRMERSLPPGREAAEAWWREVAKSKERPAWQLRQWAEAITWYLGWLDLCRKHGGSGKGIPERLKDAVYGAGSRRGLALRTKQTYAGWVARYAAVC